MLTFFIITQSLMLGYFVLRWYELLNELDEEKAKNRKPFKVIISINEDDIQKIKQDILHDLKTN